MGTCSGLDFRKFDFCPRSSTSRWDHQLLFDFRCLRYISLNILLISFIFIHRSISFYSFLGQDDDVNARHDHPGHEPALRSRTKPCTDGSPWPSSSQKPAARRMSFAAGVQWPWPCQLSSMTFQDFGYNVVQYNTIEYNTKIIQYNMIYDIIQNNVIYYTI